MKFEWRITEDGQKLLNRIYSNPSEDEKENIRKIFKEILTEIYYDIFKNKPQNKHNEYYEFLMKITSLGIDLEI